MPYICYCSFDALQEFYKDKDWMCDRITTLETHLRILSTLAPYAAVNFIRKGMGYEQYLMEYAQYRKIRPEELLEVLDRIQESTKGMKTLEEWQAYIEDYTKKLAEQAKKQEKLELKEEARQKRAAKRREWKKRTKEVFSGWKEWIRAKLPKKKQEPPEIPEDTKTSTAADPMGDTETSGQTEQTDAVEMTVTEEEQTEQSVDTEDSGTTSMEEA